MLTLATMALLICTLARFIAALVCLGTLVFVCLSTRVDALDVRQYRLAPIAQLVQMVAALPPGRRLRGDK